MSYSTVRANKVLIGGERTILTIPRHLRKLMLSSLVNILAKSTP